MPDTDDENSSDSDSSSFAVMDTSDSDSSLDDFIATSTDFDESSTSGNRSPTSDTNELRPVVIESSDEEVMEIGEVQVVSPSSIESDSLLSDIVTETHPIPEEGFDIPGIDLLSQRLVRPYFTQEVVQIAQEPELNSGEVNPVEAASFKKENNEPQRKKSKHSDENIIDKTTDDEGQSCPICFEPWTTSGEHRLVSLNCGHLFGKLCIEKWMKSSSVGRSVKSKCPQCNAIVKKNDVRPIYARCLKALDTSERDRAIKDLEVEKEKMKKIELEKDQAVLRLQMVVEENNSLKRELIDSKSIITELRQTRFKNGQNSCISGLTQAGSSQSCPKSIFKLEKTLNLSKDGGCRLMAVSNLLPLILASQPSSVQLFPGYGIRKISTLDFRPTDFVPLHSKEIKDLAFHSHDSLVLSASMDRTVKLTNVYSNTVVQIYPMEMEAWSCAWNAEEEQSKTFYVGLRNGSVKQMDTRMPATEVQQLTPPIIGSSSPVVRLQYVQRRFMKEMGFGGVLALQLSNTCFYECKGGGKFYAHPLSLRGSFTSLSMDPSSGHILVSSRPSAKQTTVKHMFGDLGPHNMPSENSELNYMYKFNVHKSVDGGPIQAQITRSQLFLDPDNMRAPLVCSGDEASQSAIIWDISNGECKQKLSANLPVLDVLNFNSDRKMCLATLTKDSLRVYKYHKYSV